MASACCFVRLVRPVPLALPPPAAPLNAESVTVPVVPTKLELFQLELPPDDPPRKGSTPAVMVPVALAEELRRRCSQRYTKVQVEAEP